MAMEILSYLPVAGAIFCAGLALFVFSRNPGNVSNIFFAIGMSTLVMVECGYAASVDVLFPFPPQFWNKIVVAGSILLPASWLSFSAVFGRENPVDFLSRWRWVLAAAWLATLFFLAVHLLPEDFVPRGIRSAVDSVIPLFSIYCLTFTVANFESTFRSADHRQRWRIKYMVLGIVSILLFLIYTLAYNLIYPLKIIDFSSLYSTIIFIGCILISFSLVRHRLLDVNVFIGRHMIYNSFSVIFVGVSFIFIALIAQFIRSYGGDFSFYLSSLFVFVSALLLAILVLSETVRKKTKRFLYENFYQFKYDYRKEWLDWTNRLNVGIGTEDLLPVIAKKIYEIFWIGRTLLWVHDEADNRYKIVNPAGEDPYNVLPFEPQYLAMLAEKDFPLLLEHESMETSRIEDPLNRRLASAGISLLVPVVIENRLLGILGLSGSAHRNPLHQEDYELMRVIAKQVGSAILRAKLTEKLLQSREKEAFHSFSAFVLHDLKNFISMLSLMLDNMDKRYDDPEFRKDMMLGVSGTVEKMKRLIEHVSVFSREPALNRKTIDLNDVIRDTIREMKASIKSRIVENYPALPAIDVDRDQMKKVITNLVLNADEANGANGEIRIQTAPGNGTIRVTVSDNGSGIPKDYLEKNLFRMFSTTKSTGFGVGLFQSKRIVEAHSGKIEVESAVGKGTTFTILLPTSGSD
jgi:hypothetical protein